MLLSDLENDEQPVVHWNKGFLRYEQGEGGRVRLYFEDGTSYEGDVLVAADGTRSKVREQFRPHIDRIDHGVIAIAGCYILNESRLSKLPKCLTDGSLNNIVPSGQGWMFISAWKSNEEHYVVWAFMLSRQSMPSHHNDMTPEELQQLVLAGMQNWNPYLKVLVREADRTTVKSIGLKSMAHLGPWSSSNVTVIGDAIHAMTPMAGIGANTALRDAELLTKKLSKAATGAISIREVVGKYEDRMLAYGNAAVDRSRRNTDGASNGYYVQRLAFRTLLRVANNVPFVMRNTIGKAVVEDAQRVTVAVR